jgi:hypothetical protein
VVWRREEEEEEVNRGRESYLSYWLPAGVAGDDRSFSPLFESDDVILPVWEGTSNSALRGGHNGP